jgi:chromosome segregation ATPase
MLMAQQEQEVLHVYRDTKAKLAVLEDRHHELTAELQRANDEIARCKEQLEKLGHELNLFADTTF